MAISQTSSTLIGSSRLKNNKSTYFILQRALVAGLEVVTAKGEVEGKKLSLD